MLETDDTHFDAVIVGSGFGGSVCFIVSPASRPTCARHPANVSASSSPPRSKRSRSSIRPNAAVG